MSVIVILRAVLTYLGTMYCYRLFFLDLLSTMAPL